MEEELDQIKKNKTWELVPRTKDKNIIGTKWVYRNKLNEEGQIMRKKGKLVCKGYSQEEGVDYGETYALVARIEAVRLFLAYVAHKNYKVYQIYVKCAFMNEYLEEGVYIKKPNVFYLSEDKDMVCRLNKALYGLKQAPRAWYARLDKYLSKLGIRKGNVDSNLYYKIEHDDILIIEVFVDDIIFAGEDSLCMKFADDMKNEFEMSMIGEMKFFLGLQITQTNKGIFICQTRYVKELLKKFGLENSKHVDTPMITSCKLSKDDESPKVNPSRYKSMIGGLLYLTQTRPDIVNVVCITSRFQSDPRETHDIDVKRILRYLAGTTNLGLWYPKNDDFRLCAYTNSDWGGDVDDKKRTIGSAFFLGKKLVSWLSKKQSCTSLSTAKVKYVAATTNST
ncbi:hypothetical protein SUGI_1160360 [Cryptomeria japonica]|nr:hypothetical protein SUGI_1160360 [Cryptomeria japonica]